MVVGVIHTLAALWDRLSTWADILSRGPWETISLDVTTDNRVYSEAFWYSPGSFGIPLLLFGGLVLWTVRRGARVPAPLGWGMTAWGAVMSALLPASPAWALLLAGVLLILAAHTSRRHGATEHAKPVQR